MKLVNKNLKPFEIVLFLLLLLYLISGVSTPYELAPYVNNVFMYGSLLLITVLLYLNANIFLAVFFVFVAAIFINRSNKVDNTLSTTTEENKNSKMKKLNNNLKQKSLEEEIVGAIVRTPDNIPGPANYHPVQCKSHNALDV